MAVTAVTACLLVCLAAIHGAPSQRDSTQVHRGVPESRNSLLVADKSEDKAVKLEDILNEGKNFEPRPKGGSFSPVRNEMDGQKKSSLPEFNRIPSLSNFCPTCVPDSFRWNNRS